MAEDRPKDVERFDEWSNTYEDSWLQRAFFDPIHKATLSLAAEFVVLPESILDVGCGTGKLLRQAGEAWKEARLFGVDPAEGMVEEARNRVPNATFYTGKAESLPLPDRSIDFAFSTMSFHHWQDQSKGLGEIVRVLRPGGCFILVDSALPGWIVWLFRLRRFHNRSQMRSLFDEVGLEVRTQKRLTLRGTLATVGVKDRS